MNWVERAGIAREFQHAFIAQQFEGPPLSVEKWSSGVDKYLRAGPVFGVVRRHFHSKVIKILVREGDALGDFSYVYSLPAHRRAALEFKRWAFQDKIVWTD